MIPAMATTGMRAIPPTSRRVRLDHSAWVSARGARTIVGNTGPPAAAPSGSRLAKVATRTVVSRERRRSARRPREAADWARPATPNPNTMNRVPAQVNSGSVEMNRIQTRAWIAHTRPPASPPRRTNGQGILRRPPRPAMAGSMTSSGGAWMLRSTLTASPFLHDPGRSRVRPRCQRALSIDEPGMEGESPRGQLELMVLAVLADGPLHGYAVISELRQRSGEVFDLPEGTV